MKRGITVLLTALLLLTVLLPAAGGAAEEGTLIRVGWVPRAGMMEAADGGYSGYNYDFLMEIQKYTGWRYEFVIGDVPTMTGMLARGEIDLLGCLLYSEERAEVFDYAELPYGEKYTVLAAAEDSPLEAYDFSGFDGIRIGALQEDAANLAHLARFAESGGFTYTVATYDAAQALAAAAASGEVDACVTDGDRVEPGLRILAEFSPVPYYFATTKGNDTVLHALNRALWQLNIDRPYLERELYEKHFGVHFDPELTAHERALVEASKTAPISVGVIASSAPACYWDAESGTFTGIFMEILRAVSEKTGLQMEFVPLDLSKGPPVSQLKQGSPQLVAGIIKTQRFVDDETLILSDVLLHDSLVIVGRKGDDFTQDATRKTVAYLIGFQVAEEYIAEQLPEHKTEGYASIDQCLNAVVSGNAEAVVYSRTCLNYLLHDPHYETLETIPAYFCDVSTCIAGLAGEQDAVVGIINKGLAMVTENERNSLIMDFTLTNPYRLSTGDLLYKYRLPLFVISLLLLAVIAVLLALNATKKRSETKLQAAFDKEQAAHEQEKAALATAEQASAAKGNFMSRMSHEIRTPLNAVIGYNTIARSEMTEAKTDAERRQAEMKVMDCLIKSDLASRHLLTIINDVLDMSAIESGKIKVQNERFDFKGMISSLTTIFYTQAKAKNVGFDVLFETMSEEWLIGDQMHVNQVLTNLLSNAVKFTPEGGGVTLAIRPDAVAEPDSVRIHFEVRDTGIGMSEEYLQRIWTPFEQADSSISRRFGGTGLGLSITKTLVDLMGGTISVESRPNEGSVFCVGLTFGRTAQPQESCVCDFSDIRALIVDDDVGTCNYIRLLFTRFGVCSTAVTSGEEALKAVALAKERQEMYTVCLVDWRMPGMDGIETIRRIRKIVGDGLAIIAITAYDYSEIADRAAEAGVTMFLSKPLFQSSLYDLLANISGCRAAKELERTVAPDFTGARVLLVEDNAMNMEIARRILESAGLAVDSAWNGREAVDRFESTAEGTYQAILMDVQMPIMDGHQATRTIRASAHPDAAAIPIIAMTADAFAENVAESFAAGMSDHIAKPIDLSVLFETLKKYLK